MLGKTEEAHMYPPLKVSSIPLAAWRKLHGSTGPQVARRGWIKTQYEYDQVGNQQIDRIESDLEFESEDGKDIDQQTHLYIFASHLYVIVIVEQRP